MTKKDLLQKIDTWGVDHIAITGIKDCVEQFFDSNVCIPKGVNRHPDADILHQWIEGAEVEFSLKGQWISFSNINDVYTEGEGVRIKPPEPVWEYQYACVDEDGKGYITGFYAPSIEGIPSDGILLEETKRVRKETK